MKPQSRSTGARLATVPLKHAMEGPSQFFSFALASINRGINSSLLLRSHSLADMERLYRKNHAFFMIHQARLPCFHRPSFGRRAGSQKAASCRPLLQLRMRLHLLLPYSQMQRLYRNEAVKDDGKSVRTLAILQESDRTCFNYVAAYHPERQDLMLLPEGETAGIY